MVTLKSVPCSLEVLKTVSRGELWIDDRCMCTLGFLFGVHTKQADFVIREHKTIPWEAVSDLNPQGFVDTGDKFIANCSSDLSGGIPVSAADSLASQKADS